MDWKDVKSFNISGKGKLVWQEVYLNHEISICTNEYGNAPGIKIFEAPDGQIQKPENNPCDITEVFAAMDEIPLSIAALRDILETIDTWDMSNKVQGMAEGNCPLEQVMLVRCIQAMIERSMKKGEITPEWGNALAAYIEKFLNMSSSTVTMTWKNTK